jgi:hypothetical protein
MIVRCCAEFRSTFPDDRIENEEGTEFLQYPGKNVATAVSEILRAIGYDADPPADAGDHGWDFEVRVKGYPDGARLWCTVTMIDDYLLVLDNTSSWDKFRKRHPAPYIEALRALGRAMAADPRFSEVRWKEAPSRNDPGAPQPVDD